ncbi:MAG: hypothetical protein RR482_03775 [Clostridia bacterium]
MRTIHVRTKRYPTRGRLRRAVQALLMIGGLYVLMGTLTGQWLPPGLAPAPTATPIALTTPAPTPHPDQTAQDMQEAQDSALVLQRQSWYAISFGVFGTRKDAEGAGANYVQRGAAGYVLEEDGFYLLSSAYPLREEADAVREQLRTQHQIDSTIYPLAAEEVELRVTASPLQISALGQGFALLPEMIEELSRLSLALDRQTMDVAAVTAAAGNNFARIAALRTTLSLSLGSSKSGIVTGLLSLLSESEKAMENISAQKGATVLELSAKIKYNHLDVLWKYVQYVRQMTAYRV